MDKLSRWLGAPGSLLVLFGTVVALPAATLVFLGVQLLQQDRALAGQRHAEILQDASDRAVRALDADLTALTRRLSDPSWRPTAAPPGAAQVLISRDETLAVPPEALAYYPVAATMKEPPAALFAGLEAAEFKAQDLPLGLDTSRRLAASADPSVQAGARQREARILRKMGRPTEALSVYRTLAAFTTISIDGEPADLFARRARCLLLEEQSRAADLRQESAALAADLDSGRWRLDRENYEYVSGQLDEWSRPTRPRRLEREAMAAAVEWLHRQWITTPGAGAAGHATGPGELAAAGARALALAAGQPPVTVVWTSGTGRVAAFVAGPQHLRTR